MGIKATNHIIIKSNKKNNFSIEEKISKSIDIDALYKRPLNDYFPKDDEFPEEVKKNFQEIIGNLFKANPNLTYTQAKNNNELYKMTFFTKHENNPDWQTRWEISIFLKYTPSESKENKIDLSISHFTGPKDNPNMYSTNGGYLYYVLLKDGDEEHISLQRKWNRDSIESFIYSERILQQIIKTNGNIKISN